MLMHFGSWYGHGISYVQAAKMYLFIGALLVFLVSGYYSFNEARYLIFGKTTSAVLMEGAGSLGTLLDMPAGRRGRREVVVSVKYAFKDTDGTVRAESDRVSPDWHDEHRTDFVPIAPSHENATITGNNGTAIAVEFIPGTLGSSRLRGNGHLFGTIPFVLSTLAVIGFGAWVWYDVQAFERHKAMKESGQWSPPSQRVRRGGAGRQPHRS
jgi:hypothetical protein